MKFGIFQVRPMQAEMGGDRMRTGAARPTRWIPAEVWQRQGMTAQVLTLPGGNLFAFAFYLKAIAPFHFTFLKFISHCRCCHTDQFG